MSEAAEPPAPPWSIEVAALTLAVGVTGFVRVLVILGVAAATGLPAVGRSWFTFAQGMRQELVLALVLASLLRWARSAPRWSLLVAAGLGAWLLALAPIASYYLSVALPPLLGGTGQDAHPGWLVDSVMDVVREPREWARLGLLALGLFLAALSRGRWYQGLALAVPAALELAFVGWLIRTPELMVVVLAGEASSIPTLPLCVRLADRQLARFAEQATP